MSRRAAAPVRLVLPDPKFGSEMLAKFMNMVMERGKKSVAETIVYGAIVEKSCSRSHGQPHCGSRNRAIISSKRSRALMHVNLKGTQRGILRQR